MPWNFLLSTNFEPHGNSLRETHTHLPHDSMTYKFYMYPGMISDIAMKAFEAAQKAAARRNSVDSISSYVPRPQTTFSPISQGPPIICAICRESRLQICERLGKDTDTTPALLPCGHVFGYKCLKTYLSDLDDNPLCPVCRLDLRYPKCGHAIEPRALDQENIRPLPDTIPLGGKIPPHCRDCSNKKMARDEEFKKMLKEVKRGYREKQTEQNHEQLLRQMDHLKLWLAEAFEKRW